MSRSMFVCMMVLLALGCGQAEAPESTGGAPGGESGEAPREVVIYTALDQIYSEPILQAFEQATGITVRPVYDSEAAKTTGLVSRLMAERGRPRCDVFWNNEIVRTIHMKNEGLLEPYESPNAEGIPAQFRDTDGTWTGFAARARVLVYNTNMLTAATAPKSMGDLLNPQLRGRVGLAYPLFGTTATHAAVLFAVDGPEAARAYFERMKANGVVVLEGNMTVCRAVAAGELPVGLTDTDDASLLMGQGRPIDFHLLDHGGEGALLIPNTVSLIKGAPNPEVGRLLIDWLLRPETEAILAASPSAQVPLHPGVEAPAKVRELAAGKFMDPQFEAAAEHLQPSADFLKALFTQP